MRGGELEVDIRRQMITTGFCVSQEISDKSGNAKKHETAKGETTKKRESAKSQEPRAKSQRDPTRSLALHSFTGC